MAELPSRSPVNLSRGPKSSSGWCFESQGKVHGPVDFRELRQLASNFEILGHHIVWKNGSEEKHPAASIVGLIPQQRTGPETPPSDLSDAQPYAPPKVRTIADGPPGGLYLPHLRHSSFLLLFGTLILSIGLAFAGWKVGNRDLGTTLYSLAGFTTITWNALAVIYLHRAWDMMRMFGAPFTGGKAVRFLFVPIFNALWCFVVLFGWSRLWNQSVQNHPGLSLATRVWRPSFLLFPIFFLIAQTLLIMHLYTREWPTDLTDPRHQISLALMSTTLILGLACWFQMTLAINFLARKKS